VPNGAVWRKTSLVVDYVTCITSISILFSDLLNMKNKLALMLLSGIFTHGALASNDNVMADLVSMSLEDLLGITVVTASRHSESLSATPATVTVINRRQIDMRGYRNLVDLLQDLPGTDIQRQNDPTRYNDITFRGHWTHRKFMILQDGVRIDAPTGETLAIADNFPLYHAQRVEIVYGPASAMYGADAFGGVINIITRSATQKDGAEVSVSRGSDDYAYYHMLANTRLSDTWTVVAGGHLHNADMADLAAEYPDQFPAIDAKTFDGKVVVPAAAREDYQGPVASRSLFARMDIGEAFSLGFQHSMFRHLTSTGDRPDGSLYLPDAVWQNQINTVYAKYKHDFSTELSALTTLNYSTHQQLPSARFNNIFTNFEDGYKYAKGSRGALEQQFNYRFNADHFLSSGFSYESFYALPRTPDLPAPYNPVLGSTGQNFYYPNTDDSIAIAIEEMRYQNVGAYMQIQSQWTPKWSSVTGLRYDKNSRYSSTLNPRLGMVYQPQPGMAYKLLYGEAFRAPSAHENQRVYGSFSGARSADGDYISSFFAAPNFGLEPEKLRNLEFTFLRQWENLQFVFSTYYTEVEDLMLARSENPPTQFIPGALLQSTSIIDNLGTERHLGVDLSLDYHYRIGRGWQADLWGAYSYIDGSLNSGNGNIDMDLPYIATHKLKLGSTFLYQDKYFITPKLYLIGATNTKRSDSTDISKRVQAPGYALLNLHAGVREILPGLALNLDIYNLADRRYGNAGGETAATNFISAPQQPRAWVVSLHYRF
jgi:outer membrane receptor for ferrienterochelin and colicins